MSDIKQGSPAGPENKGPQEHYQIPVEGSLGLLALGAAGIKAWREKRDAALKAGEKKTK